jgi:hypothetical protein
MNSREIEQLKKKSIHHLNLNSEFKDSVIQNYLNELNKIIKSNLKRKKLLVILIEEN